MENNHNIIYGIRAIAEAIEAGKEIQKVFLAKAAQGPLMKDLFRIIRDNNILYQFVPPEKLNRLVRGNHQGAIAFMSEIEFSEIKQVIDLIYEKGEDPFVLILDRITDVRNFGAIARTAVCCGVHAILIPARGSAPVNADAVKTSAGALHSIPVCRSMNLKSDILFLKDSGLKVIACTEKADKLYKNAQLGGPLALLLGSEDEGISKEYLKLSDDAVKIPLIGNIASLNVSVAAGVLCFEIVHQRNT